MLQVRTVTANSNFQEALSLRLIVYDQLIYFEFSIWIRLKLFTEFKFLDHKLEFSKIINLNSKYQNLEKNFTNLCCSSAA